MESKIELTERLRNEGRWEEASRWREARQRKLRATGKGRREASDEAWRATAEQFPPLIASVDITKPGGFQWPTEAGVGVSLTRDLRWVYANLSQRVEPCDAPNSGAWTMLQWARRHTDAFFRLVLPTLVRGQRKAGVTEPTLAPRVTAPVRVLPPEDLLDRLRVPG